MICSPSFYQLDVSVTKLPPVILHSAQAVFFHREVGADPQIPQLAK